jgi:LacI family transcriptional regulator
MEKRNREHIIKLQKLLPKTPTMKISRNSLFSRPTCNDVARLAGVSNATVSNVLNRSGAVPVSLKTRDRVMKAAAELGYERNRVAASLALGKAQTIGVVIATIEGSFHATILQGIEKKCAALGYRVMLLFTNDLQSGTSHVNGLLGDCVTGLIVVGDFSVSEISNWCDTAAQQQTPVVLVDRPLLDKHVDCVSSDDRHGSLVATKYLVGLGHRRIAHLAGDLSQPAALNRCEGYRETLQKAGLIAEEIVTEDGSYRSEAFCRAVTKLLEPSVRPTAVFAATDFHASVVLQIALHRGLRVPGDLAVMGYGDTETSRAMSLTSVSQNAEQMGVIAVERLLTRLSTPSLPPDELIVTTRLVVRNSCGTSVDI